MSNTLLYCPATENGARMKLVLRDYQEECIEEIVRRGAGRHLVHMATGLGKTVTFSSIPRTGRTLILSHRMELVEQPRKYYDCSFGVEAAERYATDEEVVSASVQTLRLDKRLHRFSPGEFDTIITDEAHHAVADSYRKIYDYFKPRVHIGFSATPNRGDKVRLDGVFDDIIFSRSLVWGIEEGWLCDIDAKRVEMDCDLSRMELVARDYKQSALGEAVC